MADSKELLLHSDYALCDWPQVEARVKEAVALRKAESYVEGTIERFVSKMDRLVMAEADLREQTEIAEFIVRGYKRITAGIVAYQLHEHGWMSWLGATQNTPMPNWIGAIFREKQSTILNLSMSWQMANWMAEGKRLFMPSEALCRRIEGVDLRGVPADMVTLPFRAFSVQIPWGVGIPVPDTAGQEFPLRTLYVTDDPRGAPPGAEYMPDHATDEETMRRVHVMAIGQWRKREQFFEQLGRSITHYDDQLYHWSIPIGAMKTLDTYLDDIDIERCVQLGGVEANRPKLVALTRWVMWLLVYMSDSQIRRDLAFLDPATQKAWDKAHKHPKGSGKRKRATDEARKLSQQRVIRIGADVRPPSPGAHTGRKLEVRQYVRGHRKRVPAGPGRVDRKEVSIAPYWRGPEGGEETYSQYMLR